MLTCSYESDNIGVSLAESSNFKKLAVCLVQEISFESRFRRCPREWWLQQREKTFHYIICQRVCYSVSEQFLWYEEESGSGIRRLLN